MAKSYGQFCPVAKAAELFCERWTPLILRDLAGGATRFSELRRGVPLASPSLLSQRLKQLEAEGVVERRRSPGGSSWTYHLTPAGAEFAPIIEALGVWGQRWTRRDLQEHEVDLTLFLWAMEKSVRPAAFGERRTLVRLELVDQPPHKRFWWFLNEAGRCELCVKEPGFEVDLWLRARLPDMILLWRGDLPVGRALEGECLEAEGPSRLRRALRAWLPVCALAEVGSQRTAAADDLR